MAAKTARIALALIAGAVAILPVFRASLVHTVLAGEDGELPRKAYLGVRLAPLPTGAGVLIEAVVPDTAAAAGGIRQGDVLLAMAGRTVSGVADVMTAIASMSAGQELEVTLLRAGRQMMLPVTLKERPRDRGGNFDVLYHHVVSGGARIRTIVTRPHASTRQPALVLIQGLGPTTVDQPLNGPDPYSRILNELARSGYVTVRVEKPGIGDSEGGPFSDLDFQTELDTYRQALIAVRKYSFVDADNVFIFGHSMGGVFGPIIASEMPIKGIAVYGTVAKTWTEYFLENWRRQSLLTGNDPAQMDSMLRDLAALLHDLLVDHKGPDEILRARPHSRSTLAKLAPGGRIDGRALPFWSQLAARNLPEYWAKGNAHVLAVWGRHDFVATEADHPFIVEIVNKARIGKGTYIALEGSDHAFRKTTSVEDSFRRWNSTGGEFNPEITTTLKAWMEKVRIRE
jgi:pimeloyl-ACP methyl ester carboxylesterase